MKKISSFICALAFSIQAAYATNLTIINHTIGPGAPWMSGAVIRVNNISTLIYSQGNYPGPSKKSIHVQSNKINIQMTKFIFGNTEQRVDSSCVGHIVANKDDHITFSIFASPTNTVGYGDLIFCTLNK